MLDVKCRLDGVYVVLLLSETVTGTVVVSLAAEFDVDGSGSRRQSRVAFTDVL